MTMGARMRQFLIFIKSTGFQVIANVMHLIELKGSLARPYALCCALGGLLAE
jgi:hypothetical protein